MNKTLINLQQFESLKRYANRFSIELDLSASFSDYVSAVSKYIFILHINRHFVMDYDVDEDSTIVEFLQSLQNVRISKNNIIQNKIKPLKPSQLKTSATKKPKTVAPVLTTHSDSQSDEEGVCSFILYFVYRNYIVFVINHLMEK